MPRKDGTPGYLEAQRKEGRTTNSRDVIPPPSTLSGYSLHLVDNQPSDLTPRFARRRINRFRKELNGKGAWDNFKVDIASAYAVNWTGNDEVIYYTTKPATYFQHRAGINHHTNREKGRQLSHSGNMVIAITGDRKIVLSTRPDNVNLYPRTITTTASGSWEGKPQTPISKLPNGAIDYSKPLPMLVPATPEDAINQMRTELSEETGLDRSVIDTSRTTMIGIAEDRHKYHRDLLWMVELPEEMTQERLNAIHKDEKQLNNHGNDPMAGHLIFFDATPAAIEKYLIEPQMFWDGDADKALVAVGKMLFMRQLVDQDIPLPEANKQATAWMEILVAKSKQKRQERNEIVKKHRKETIKGAWKARRRAWGEAVLQQFNLVNRELVRNARQKARRAGFIIDDYRGMSPNYDAHRDPKEQGGKDVKEALIEIGHPIITSSIPPSVH